MYVQQKPMAFTLSFAFLCSAMLFTVCLDRFLVC